MHDGDQSSEALQFHPNTWKTLRADITPWVLNPHRSEKVLWLKGIAGTGKSMLSKKLANTFHDAGADSGGQLAASFFFLTEGPTRNHPGRFVVTIAYRLAVSFPDVGERIGAAIARDRTLLTAGISHQWVALVVKPVKDALGSTLPAVIIIDGLDQCGSAEDQRQILSLISSCGPDFPIAFLITSRPEPHLLSAFEEYLGRRAVIRHRAVELGDSEESRTEMRAYLRHSFTTIRKKTPFLFTPGIQWPDAQAIDKILDWASGRYLHLSIIVKSVGSDNDPHAALDRTLVRASTYNGTFQKLVVAIDIGTTHSGVSYSILDPCTAPKILHVTRFPGQDGYSRDSRIPSIVVYDQLGQVRAVGAEINYPALQVQMVDEKWSRADWFKLHLRPKDLDSVEIAHGLPPLPPNKTATAVLADFLHYIVQCTQQFIIEKHFNGAVLWESSKDFILTHPNGWGSQQQYQMQNAALMAGIVPDTQDGRKHIHFLSEGNASLYYCIAKNILPRNSTTRNNVLIIDAGGGTIDTSAYRKRQEWQRGTTYEEISIPQCFLQGSALVTQRAHSYLQEYLTESKYSDDIPAMVSVFDRTTKPGFNNSDQAEYIHFGRVQDNDINHNIRNGILKLDEATISGFFEPSIKCMKSVIEQSHSRHRTKTVLLVGGFAANEWVFKSLKSSCDPIGVSIYRPDHHTGKAVAGGAVAHFLERYLRARISKFAVGIAGLLRYNPEDPEHVLRKSQLATLPDGSLVFSNCFDTFLPKNTRVTEECQYRRSFSNTKLTYQELINCRCQIKFYGHFGELARPQWMNENPDDYRLLGEIPVRISDFRHVIRREIGSHGDVCYKIYYDVIIFFGSTELKAQIGWKESPDGDIKYW
ncbi:hypothetical protein AX16_009486 [Volvariella volvacea WC 439]|nr:hypothetical protein AX16_009486 [Volvariella volvacea WC 439]